MAYDLFTSHLCIQRARLMSDLVIICMVMNDDDMQQLAGPDAAQHARASGAGAAGETEIQTHRSRSFARQGPAAQSQQYVIVLLYIRKHTVCSDLCAVPTTS